MRFRVRCKSCGRFLTESLEPVAADFEPDWCDHENIVPRGHFWNAESLNGLSGTRVIIHIDDRAGLTDHRDALRFHGCCGPSADKVNQVCACGAEVATLVADCWTSYYVHFEPKAIELTAAIEDTPEKTASE